MGPVISLLIAVKSCQNHRVEGYNDAIRRTWGRDVRPPAKLLFFHGDGCLPNPVPQSDEIGLPVGDDYNSLPKKTKAILRYFLQTDFDYCFLCDTDTYVIPAKLLTSGFEKYDVSGRFGVHPEIGTTFKHIDDRHNVIENCHPWPSGGVGYFLSRKAADYVVNDPYMGTHWAEDFSVGQITGPLIQSGVLTAADLPEFDAQTAWHFSRRQHGGKVYDLSFGWMDKLYQEHGGQR